ncbi:MAG: hypothetical protein H7A23_20685 [Leptospiraceae bacterium]|nr:hypothetical protein [Leptospiraceae bacterium]MCP5496978.1 hypothetical protein [Leptospiraceae bacterium]
MKQLIIIFVLSFTFNNCDFRMYSKRSDDDKLFERLFIMDLYFWVNICPPKDATLEPGNHTITLNEGEEYWFNISKNAIPYASYDIYKVSITELSGQTISVGYSNCLDNGQITNPSPKVKAEGREPSFYEDGFAIYLFRFSGDASLAGIKSTSGSGEIQIKVP